MCRIGCIKSLDPIHPSKALYMMLSQQKGHDNSGFAIVMTDLYGIFKPYKDMPMLSYSSSHQGIKIIEDFMMEKGFSKKIFRWEPKTIASEAYDFEKMDFYGFDVFNYPEALLKASQKEREKVLLDTRLELRKVLECTGDGFVFSFWPDTLTLKEIGNPNHIGEYFNLWEEDDKIVAKNIMIQYRQNTNYEIVRYAAHPFFIQGYTLCANGENTFYIKNKECQQSLHKGYLGFESDSQCFLYTLHYVHHELGWPLQYYKHVITPLPFEEINTLEPAKQQVLYKLRESLTHLEINGPNTIIGLLPDHTMFTVCDSKKLRPVVVGSNGRMTAITSEVTGINSIMPERDLETDIYPGERETVIIDHELKVKRWNQI
ncbi:MAG: glutamate synthase [Candidatus Margulisbacteria bacterium GWF2_35_9]|nr:MAG: glutamate synthase [Candidatus Margulisbacteria bacterium GWF2_35_9]